MPCALTSDADYPDYLKKILKEIDIGDDDELTNCACKLVTPITDEGCEILDEDNKVGAFPFCCTLVTDGVGEDTEYPLKLTLKQAMNLYWQTTSWNFVASANGYSCSYSTIINFTGSARTSLSFVDEVGPPPPQKNLVCRNFFQYLTNYTGESCGSLGCSSFSENNTLISSMFESLDYPMKYKKEGGIYYFYPLFNITIGSYGACTSTMVSSAETCTDAQLGITNGPDSLLTVKILNESCFPVKLYTRIMSDTADCRHGGSASISSLEFTGSSISSSELT